MGIRVAIFCRIIHRSILSPSPSPTSAIQLEKISRNVTPFPGKPARPSGRVFVRHASSSTETSTAESSVQARNETKKSTLGTPPVTEPPSEKNVAEGLKNEDHPIVRKSEPGSATFPPLEAPPRVRGYPTPWMNLEDMQQYLLPLYPRGWGLRYRYQGPKTETSLVGTYQFQTESAAAAFLEDIAELAKSENHHPTDAIQRKIKRPTVLISIRTDSASRSMSGTPISVPGITRRDLRFAILLDALYCEKYAGEIKQRVPRPPKEQVTCEKHFSVARVRGKPKVWADAPPHVKWPHYRRIRKPRDYRARPPKKACPNCKGDHWLEDCREPQIPQAVARRLMLPIPPA